MKKPLLSLTMLLFIIGLSAQTLSKDFEVTASEGFTVVDAPEKRYIALGNGQIISLKATGATVTIQLFDGNQMKEISRNKYEDFPKYQKIQDVIHIGDKIYYIYEAYNKKEKTFSVYSREINVAKATFLENKKLFTTSRPIVAFQQDGVSSTSGPLSGSFFKFGKKVKVYKSFDASNIMIGYRLKPIERNDALNHYVLGFYVFDSNMNKKWGEEVKMPHTEKEMNNLAYTVDKNGTAFMIAFMREGKKFELIKINSEGKTETKPLDINGDLVFEKFQLLENNSGEIICVGYYANGYDFKMSFGGGAALSFNTNGIYTFKMDNNGKVLSTSDIPFSLDLIKQYLSERQAEKMKKREADGKAGISDLRIKKIFTQDDGSIIVIGEQQYMRNEYYGTSSQNVYHYSNIVISKLDENGKEVWTKKLPKNQAGIINSMQISPFFEGQMSIAHAKGEGSHYILFVDNPKNEKLPLNKVPAAHKNGAGGFMTAFKVSDSDGSIERHTIADLSKVGGVRAYQFKVTRILEAMDKVFFMEVYIKGKKDAMIKMQLN